MDKPVRKFFVLTFCLSWIFWLPMIMVGEDHFLLRVAGTYGPLTAAVLLTANREGLKGLKKLLSSLLLWKTGLIWYVFCFFSTAVLALIALGIYSLLDRNKLLFNDPSQLFLSIPIFIYVLIFSVLGEETGWRGFALPKLQEKYGTLKASFIIGLIWAFWHSPLFFIEGNFHQEIPLWLFILQEIYISIVISWIYNKTGGSLLLVHIFHAASNTTLGLLPVLPQETGGDRLPLYILCGLLTILTYGIVRWGNLEEASFKEKLELSKY
ncbi:CPBP family intramembrane glutamic endopeptidase [Oceanispirochaeta crateris]|nr:type II CAAX endopeptidase family protein [Oceanispirochaeta crateris]